MIPTVGIWTETVGSLGVLVSADAYSGNGAGAYIANSALNPANWTRSYSRSAYIDPLPPRPNLSILPNATVTKIIFSNTTSTNGLVATGIEFAASATAATRRAVSSPTAASCPTAG